MRQIRPWPPRFMTAQNSAGCPAKVGDLAALKNVQELR